MRWNFWKSRLKNIEVKPWQFANITMNDDVWEFTRSYSVVKNKDNILTFWIKLKKWWRWWELLKKLWVWDKLIFWWIHWKFVLRNTENPKIFIATWTWLSPIMNMINSWLNSKQNFLLFWVAYKKDLFYLDKIQKIKNLKSKIFLSREEDICWNPWLVNNTKKYLQEKGYKNVYSEEF